MSNINGQNPQGPTPAPGLGALTPRSVITVSTGGQPSSGQRTWSLIRKRLWNLGIYMGFNGFTWTSETTVFPMKYWKLLDNGLVCWTILQAKIVFSHDILRFSSLKKRWFDVSGTLGWYFWLMSLKGFTMCFLSKPNTQKNIEPPPESPWWMAIDFHHKKNRSWDHGMVRFSYWLKTWTSIMDVIWILHVFPS